MADAEDGPVGSPALIETMGVRKDEIDVQISTRFLQHFSEFMYSSPQKAFEELIANGWDAGANVVDVRVSERLEDPRATLCVLDNGTSMDLEGLHDLWHIAFSPKRVNTSHKGREVTGKFGIGKLATYVLAGKLTYVCKAADGVIRRVTMDYSTLDEDPGAKKDELLNKRTVEVFEVAEDDVATALADVQGGDELLRQIEAGMKPEPNPGASNEFNAAPTPPVSTGGTWTLVVMSDLKRTGRDLKIGYLRRMLSAALPFNSDLTVRVNGVALRSSKIDAPVMETWTIGPELGIDEVEIAVPEDDDRDEDGAAHQGGDGEGRKTERVRVTSVASQPPHVELPGIGKVTGTVTLFRDQISGGKSDARGSSNGFHVNLLGRVVNQADPTFGGPALSHASWARFRMAVRADGLNEFITTNREQFKETRELRIFRAFLRQVFNVVRGFYDRNDQLTWKRGGDALIESLGVVSLSPLRNVVSESLAHGAPFPGLFDERKVGDREQRREVWHEQTEDDIRNALHEVRFGKLDDGSFVKFDLSDNAVVVNADHPFTAEYSRSRGEKEVVRTIGMVNLLSDMFALDTGIAPQLLDEVRTYRDRLMRFKAVESRSSGTHIAQILLRAQRSPNDKELEGAVSAALTFLGFEVEDMAGSGEPEGIASAFVTPHEKRPAPIDATPLYKVAFDAKSTKGRRAAQTGNVHVAGLVRHRTDHGADYSLVVAPDYQRGAIDAECATHAVTPMRAADLGRLLELTATYGAISLTRLRGVFKLHGVDLIGPWIDELEQEMLTRRVVTVDILLKAFGDVKGTQPKAMPAETLAHEIRQRQRLSVDEDEVIDLVRGLAVIVPDLIGVIDNKIVVSASPERIASAIATQLEKLHEAARPDATGA